MRPEQGSAFFYEYFAAGGDSISSPTSSNVVLFENGTKLGSGHSQHADIRAKNGGRFSHWGQSLYFSSSDGTDPRTNGRRYSWGVRGSTCPTMICGPIDAVRASPDSGLSFVLERSFGFKGDASSFPRRSSLQLFENGVQLGPGHSFHADIRAHGKGRFSHWGNALFFSTSDGSDPRSNNRKYTYGGDCRALKKIEFNTLSSTVPGYATFQSHNQKVLSNQFGVFIVHLSKTYDADSEDYTWQLKRSTDNGATFKTVYEGRTHSKAPAIESDEAGNIYLFVSDYPTQNAFMYRFSPNNGYLAPIQIVTIPGGSAGKFAAVYDSTRKRLYYNGWSSKMWTLDLEGNILGSKEMVRSGQVAGPQYPHLAMLGGKLFFAWTSVFHGKYLYWDAHAMKSEDGGATWLDMNSSPITTPVAADHESAAYELVPSGELGYHNWLANMLPKGDAVHFMYMNQAPSVSEHYIRYNLKIPGEDIRTPTEFRGQIFSLRSLDGFFSSPDETETSTLYAVSVSIPLPGESQSRIAVLASDDNGRTWFDYAYSPFTMSPYAVTGSRRVSLGGDVHGMFVNQSASGARDSHQLIYFRVPADP
ncbi:MAG: hypothetical protein AB7G93_19070 [Bdellovibrionales bacterium]